MDVPTLRAYFAATGFSSDALLRNYHHEEKVSPDLHGVARPASVLLGIVDDASPRIVLTRRQESISAPGQICFPGGTRDFEDEDSLATALRETHEELGVDPARIEVLGTLGRYYSHSGHVITPVVALLRAPLTVRPNPAEVQEVLYLPLEDALRPDSYALMQHDQEDPLAHYHLVFSGGSVTGPTVCILMHLYEVLAAVGRREGGLSEIT